MSKSGLRSDGPTTSRTMGRIMKKEFAGHVALITGGSRGIGRAIARQLARGGADVAIGYGSRREDAEAAVKEIQATGQRALCAPCDLRNQDQIDAFVGKSRDELGPIGLLINAGAISNFANHTQMTWDLWYDTLDVNLHGVFRILFAVKDEMIERKFGRVVLISSIAAYTFRPQQLHYATSKSAVIAMTAWCAEAFGPHNVRVNCIAPGLVDTFMQEQLRTRAPDDRYPAVEVLRGKQHTPDMPQPEDAAEVLAATIADLPQRVDSGAYADIRKLTAEA